MPQKKRRKQIIIKDGIINLISGDIDLEGVPPANRGRLSPTAYSYSQKGSQAAALSSLNEQSQTGSNN